jgi:hypothetical protein
MWKDVVQEVMVIGVFCFVAVCFMSGWKGEKRAWLERRNSQVELKTQTSDKVIEVMEVNLLLHL